jgi:hypothetical protein
MPDRRLFLRLAVTAGAAVCAGCGTTKHPTSTAGAAALSCVDPTPGTVTNPTGSVNGTSAADLIDAYSDLQGLTINWQLPAVLSNKAGAGKRYRLNQVAKGEKRLIVTLVGGDMIDGVGYPDIPPDPGYRQFDIGVQQNEPDGDMYEMVASWATNSTTNCKQTQKDATGGWVRYAVISDSEVRADYDLTFGSGGTVAGSFVAPRVSFDGCPARPVNQACVTA